MASQNITGIAVLNSFGYSPDPGSMFRWTGLFSLVAAPFGGHAVNLAAITAAMCADRDAHPDSTRRYWSAVVAGAVYIVFGLTASAAVAFINVSPPILIAAVAGLALIGAFGGSLVAALSVDKHRESALITFLVTASGVTIFGVGGAFWGLLAGCAVYLWDKPRPVTHFGSRGYVATATIRAGRLGTASVRSAAKNRRYSCKTDCRSRTG